MVVVVESDWILIHGYWIPFCSFLLIWGFAISISKGLGLGLWVFIVGFTYKDFILMVLDYA